MGRNFHRALNRTGAAASLVVLLSVAACGSSGDKIESGNINELEAKQAALEARERELNKQASDLAAQQASLSSSSSSSHAMAVSAGLLPPHAKPGECYTRVWQPPTYKTQSEQRLLSEASERIEIIPAKYGNVTKRVMVQEASTKLVTVPATYKTVSERVLVQPAKTELVQVPPVYETVTERVLDKPAHTTWKKGTGPIQRIDDTTGEIMCLVEIPATYKTITKQVLKTPATTRERTTPARYETVTKRVVDQPATTKTIDIPAQYKTITVVEQTKPAEQRRIPIPAKYTTVSSQKLVKSGEMQWREILCETNTTPDRIVKIQTALMKAGFNPGPIDGTLGSSTMRAVNAFQRSKGLPEDRYLNVATVKALGVSPR